MLKIDRNKQTFTRLEMPNMQQLELLERQHLQEFIVNSAAAFFAELGEDLCLVGSEVQPSTTVLDRIDLLALDREGNAVVIELKRGSQKLHLLQAISYAAMLAQWEPNDFLALCDHETKDYLVDFLEVETEDINREQRLILLAEAFEYEVLVSAEWLNERFGVDVACSRFTLSKDAQSGEEYLACGTVYPAPELVAQARQRSGRRSRGSGRWRDWEEALGGLENAAVTAFFEGELEDGRECYLPKKLLRYRMGGKRRWNISARRKLAYVWQSGRFEKDTEFWRNVLSDPDEVVPVKNGACLRFHLKTTRDFEAFAGAVAEDLVPAEWQESPSDNDSDIYPDAEG